jgi:hypothetical protein
MVIGRSLIRTFLAGATKDAVLTKCQTPCELGFKGECGLILHYAAGGKAIFSRK